MIDKASAESHIEAELKNQGFQLGPLAMRPFVNFGFEKLHEIHDHEERYLKDNIIQSIIDAFQKRTRKEKGLVNEDDVKAGILLLGNRIRKADPKDFDHKDVIRDACPYC